MYLSNIKLWNFRKYGPASDFEENPNLDLNFEKGLNVLIGANDSGKTAILDAIKLVLKPNTGEWIKLDMEEDFHNGKNQMKINLTFENFSELEARHFTEFLSIENDTEKLILSCEISHNGEKIFHYDVKAGKNGELGILSAEQKELLNVTYLKPLRDVKMEFIPKKNSRLSTILQSHNAFKGKNESHILMDIFKNFDDSINKYFSEGLEIKENKGGKEVIIEYKEGKDLKEEIDKYIKKFLDKDKEGNFATNPGTLKNILERLELTIKGAINPGLGSLNRLFIASELLHLERDNDGLQLGLIEEVEAHIHPQAQMKVIEALQEKAEDSDIQIILTTHSPNLASKVKLKNLIICTNGNAFSMGSQYTNLDESDYSFMERFIDVTKSNLFFSEGVIFVEGWAEEIILPSLTKILKNLQFLQGDLTANQVSVVNIGHASFGRYKSLFERKNSRENMGKNIAIITDFDFKPQEYEKYIIFKGTETDEEKQKKLKTHKVISGYESMELDDLLKEKENALTNPNFNIQGFVSPVWTLEYCLGLFKPFQKHLYHAILLAFKEKYEAKTKFGDLDNFINEFQNNPDEKINELGSTNEEIATKLCNMVLGEEKIANLSKLQLSKSLVAQYFANFLEENINEFQKEGFEKESSISYLINAIKHACNQ